MRNDSAKPNILFVLTDQQRWDTCGCYGQILPLTPNLDRMAAKGVRFEFAFTPQPVCGPARACLHTGKYATEVGCHVNHRMLPFHEDTLAKILSSNGYETGYIGKWHLASSGPPGGPDDYRTRPVPPERRGGFLDYWMAADVLEFTSHSYDGYLYDGDGNRHDFPPNRYRVSVLTDWTIEYLQSKKNENPFFLFVSYLEPHHQNDHQHFEGPHGSKEKYKDFYPPADLRDLEGDWQQEYPDYLGCVNSIDENLGRILQALEQYNLLENTLIIFSSDHGSHFRTRNNEYKRSCHDSCIRVPLVLQGPGFRDGKVISNLVSLIDLPPTILSAAGVAAPATLQGRALQPLVSDPHNAWLEEVFLQISESQCGRAIRTPQWKYAVRAPHKTGQDPNSDVYVEDYLYDLQQDPYEQNNLVANPELAVIRNHLSERLKHRMQLAGEAIPEILPLQNPI